MGRGTLEYAKHSIDSRNTESAAHGWHMSKDEIKEAIRDYLGTEFGVPLDEHSDSDRLFSAGVLDSLNALNVLGFLESQFGLKINALDITLQDIDSVEMIAEFTAARTTQ